MDALLVVAGGAAALGALGLLAAVVDGVVRAVRGATDPGARRAMDAEDARRAVPESLAPTLRALARWLDDGRLEGTGELHRANTTVVEGRRDGRAVRVALDVGAARDGARSRSLSVGVEVRAPGAFSVVAPTLSRAIVEGAVAGLAGFFADGPPGRTETVEGHGLRLVAPVVPGTQPGDPDAPTRREALAATLERLHGPLATLCRSGGIVSLDGGRLVHRRGWSPAETEPLALRAELELLARLADDLEGAQPARAPEARAWEAPRPRTASEG